MLSKIISRIADKDRMLQKQIHELKSISVEITRYCNLQCKHCYMFAENLNHEKKDTYEKWCVFFDQIYDVYGKNVVINITGGEPFYDSNALKAVKYISNLGMPVTIATNGLLINKKAVDFIDKNISSVSISLDGFAHSHNYIRSAEIFDKVVNNIVFFKKNSDIPLTIKTTICKKNIENLKNFYSFLKELEIDIWNLFPMEPVGRGEQNKEDVLSLEEYKDLCSFVDSIKDEKMSPSIIFEEGGGLECHKTCELFKVKKCSAGINSCAVLFNGDIVRCIQDNRDKLNIYGNIFKDDFVDIWENQFQSSRSKEYSFCSNHYFLENLKNENS